MESSRTRTFLSLHPVPLIFAGLSALCAILAAIADKPWSKEILRRLKNGKTLTWEQLTVCTQFYALAVGAGLLLVTALLHAWLSRKHQKEPTPARPLILAKSAHKQHRWFWLGFVALLFVAVALRVPRMNLSLWNDEMYHLEMFVIGETQHLTERNDCSHTWHSALHKNPKANLHTTCVIESRLMQALWRAWHPETTRYHFSETWLRLPSLAWGLFGIVMLTLAIRRFGGDGWALAVMLLLAVHPWHIRFSAEIRGYAAMLAGLSLVAYLLVKITQSVQPSWLLWIGLAGAYSLTIVALVPSVAVLLPLSMFLLLAGLRARRWDFIAAFLSVMTPAAVFVAWMNMSTIIQANQFLKKYGEGSFPELGKEWLLDSLSGLICGQEWVRGHWSTQVMSAGYQIALGVGFLVLLVLGSLRLWRHGTAGRVLGFTLVLGALIYLIQHLESNRGMLSWYYLALLPLLLVVLSAGAYGSRAGGAALTAYLVGLIPGWRATIAQPRQPLREALTYLAKHYPGSPHLYLGITWQHVEPYLPTIKSPGPSLSTREVWLAAEEAAAQKQVPCVLACTKGQQAAGTPIWQHILERKYRKVAEFTGWSAALDMEIWERMPNTKRDTPEMGKGPQ